MHRDNEYFKQQVPLYLLDELNDRERLAFEEELSCSPVLVKEVAESASLLSSIGRCQAASVIPVPLASQWTWSGAGRIIVGGIAASVCVAVGFFHFVRSNHHVAVPNTTSHEPDQLALVWAESRSTFDSNDYLDEILVASDNDIDSQELPQWLSLGVAEARDVANDSLDGDEADG